MKVEQIYTGCLAEAAYYIESEGEAAIIDPLRETTPYINRAAKDGAKIKYIFETHFHADFVSGHVELAQKTGAQIVYGPKAECDFECYIAKDEEEFTIGRVKLKVLHTPGHTLESSTYLLLDEKDKPHCIFTGDTLFIGDVGRPDLAIKADVTERDLAGMLYDSLHSKIMTLPDELIVYPAHGAGSSCGKSMSKETFDTLGHQKRVNYALQDISKEEFIREVTDNLLPPPQYFAKNAMMNKQGAGNLEEVYSHSLKSLSPGEFESLAKGSHALVLDTRDAEGFSKGFIPGSINISLNGQFAVWVGTLITDLQQEILLVCEKGKEKECVMRLARVGYDNTIGYLEGGIEAWKEAGKPVDSVQTISATEFAKRYNPSVAVLDVRRPSEYEVGHLSGAENKPLDFINDWTHELQAGKTYHLHCSSGYRSMTAASILKSRGFEKVIDITDGYKGLVKTSLPQNALIQQT
jgi:hydroxyacylglutathione hydrolase